MNVRILKYFAMPVLLVFFGLTVGSSLARADGDTSQSCGDADLTCGAAERCCTHTVAMFADGGANMPTFKEGACVPRQQRCADFWCGPRHCSSGIFGTPSVCCVSNLSGQTAEYRCAYSELNCPGNTAQLQIRSSAS